MVLSGSTIATLGAAVGLAFGAGAARPVGAGLLGIDFALAAGVAWALDFRGLVALPAAAGLVLLGGLQFGIKLCVRLLAFILVFAGPYAQDARLQQTQRPPAWSPAGWLCSERDPGWIGRGLVGGDEVRRAVLASGLSTFRPLQPRLRVPTRFGTTA